MVESLIELRNFIYTGIIIAAFLGSWRSGLKVLARKESFWLSALVSILLSAIILTPGGYFGSYAEPDMIGKALVPYSFFIMFLIINAINLLIFGWKKWGRTKQPD
jgi:hypothetical protein